MKENMKSKKVRKATAIKKNIYSSVKLHCLLHTCIKYALVHILFLCRSNLPLLVSSQAGAIDVRINEMPIGQSIKRRHLLLRRVN